MPTTARTSRKPAPATSSPSPASRASTTGDTLCDPANPVVLETMDFPEPVIEVAVEPKTKADQEKMGLALGRLAQEDPSFRVSTDQETRPDHHQGHGRAPSRDHRRPPAAATSRSTPMSARRRSPIARRISRTVEHRLHPQEADRRLGPVRPRQDRASSRGRRARASSSRTRSSAARCRRSSSPASRRASTARATPACSPASR